MRLFDWALELLPPGGRAPDFRSLPPELSAQFDRLGIPAGRAMDRMRYMHEHFDQVIGVYGALLGTLPTFLREQLTPSDRLAVGSVFDVAFNGEVRRADRDHDTGYVILISMGALMLTGAAAQILMMLADASTQTFVSETGAQAYGIHQKWLLRIHRRKELRRATRDLTGFEKLKIGDEFLQFMKLHASLGVVDLPPSLSERLPVPVGHDLRRLGHPLEAGTYLAHYAERFLLLHECGHLILGHVDRQALSQEASRQDELDADNWALETIARYASDDRQAAVGLFGAIFLASLCSRLEALDLKNARTHPPAVDRLLAIRTFVATSRHLSHKTRAQTLALMGSLHTVDEMLHNIDNMLAKGRDGFDPLENVLTRAADDGDPVTFQDQMLRWLFQAMPDRLSRRIGEQRLRIELEAKTNPDDAVTARKLEMLRWVYDIAERNDKRANDFLARGYADASATAASWLNQETSVSANHPIANARR